MSLSLLAVLPTGCEPMASPDVNANPLVGVKGDESPIDTPVPISGGGSLSASDDDPDEDDDWEYDDVQTVGMGARSGTASIARFGVGSRQYR